MPLALVSDIHGNDVALAAVVAELERLGTTRVICLGDAVQGGPQPARGEVAEPDRELHLQAGPGVGAALPSAAQQRPEGAALQRPPQRAA